MNKKMRRKNQISKYYFSSSVRIIRKIKDQLRKNFLTQWEIEEENKKIYKV